MIKTISVIWKLFPEKEKNRKIKMHKYILMNNIMQLQLKSINERLEGGEKKWINN